MGKKGKRKRPTSYHADLLLFEGGFQTTKQERGGVPTLALRDRYFRERTPGTFGYSLPVCHSKHCTGYLYNVKRKDMWWWMQRGLRPPAPAGAPSLASRMKKTIIETDRIQLENGGRYPAPLSYLEGLSQNAPDASCWRPASIRRAVPSESCRAASSRPWPAGG